MAHLQADIALGRKSPKAAASTSVLSSTSSWFSRSAFATEQVNSEPLEGARFLTHDKGT
jgi:hypothetical protein